MLLLGKVKSKERWQEAGLELTLTPLLEDKEKEFRKLCTERVYNEGKLVDVEFDEIKFYELVGKECIHDWSGEGVGDENGNPVSCTEENIVRFMKVKTAREFVMSKVRSLQLCLKQEEEEAKND